MLRLTIRRALLCSCVAVMLPGGLSAPFPPVVMPPAAAEPIPRLVGSDFNGDGYSDLAVNIVDSGFGSDQENVDAVVVLHGSKTGLSAAGRQRLVASDFRGRPTKDATRPLGRVMATGNFDGDRYTDLVLSELVARVGGATEVDAVRVVYGSARGLNPGRTELWTQHSRGVPGRAEPDDEFGSSFAVGDFGRSKHDDLAITVGSEDTAVGASSGAVIVLYGSSRGLVGAGSQSWTSSTPGIPGVGEDFELFGNALAAGRFSASGYDDLAIGVPSRTVGGHQVAGAVVVLRGSRSGLTTRGSQLWTQDSFGMRGRAQDDDAFGESLAVGQLGRGSQEDLAIGAPSESIAGREGAGAVHIVYGSSRGLSAAGNQMWTQKGRSVAGIPEIDDNFGGSLVAANLGFDGDGTARDDLAISVDESVHGVYRAGQVHVLFGRDDGLSAENSQILITSTAGLVSNRQMNDEFGAGLATGDFGAATSGTSYADLVARMSPDEPISASRVGIQILYGGPRGPGPLGAQLWTPRALGERDPTRKIYEVGAQDSDRSY